MSSAASPKATSLELTTSGWTARNTCDVAKAAAALVLSRAGGGAVYVGLPLGLPPARFLGTGTLRAVAARFLRALHSFFLHSLLARGPLPAMLADLRPAALLAHRSHPTMLAVPWLSIPDSRTECSYLLSRYLLPLVRSNLATDLP